MKQLLKNFALVFIVLFIAAGLWGYAEYGNIKPETVGINRLVTEIKTDQVSKIEVQGSTILATLDNPEETQLEVRKESGQPFSELMQTYGVTAEELAMIGDVQIKEQSGILFWMAMLAPYLLPLLLIVGLLFFMTRQASGMNNKAMGFGQSSARQAKPDDKDKKTFKDVAGAAEAKEELEEIVDFLKDPKKFADMGAKIPKGVLLMGAPGTGKTLLAKAVAGEAGVPFFHISGSEFVEMFVGVGASRVRDLFNKAKKEAPAIIFVDEIDAVGRKRGSGLGGSHDEREQTLNQILVEMDGFDPNIGVIVMAATNRPDVLDSALLRPGRFDRRVTISKPDIKDREAILKVHAANKPFEKEVDLKNLAERTPGFTGADLANLLNEAAIYAVRNKKKTITQDDVLESIEKVLLGPQKRSKVMSKKEREMTAYHEAGHAIVGHFLEFADPIRKVSIIGRGMAGGYTLSMPTEDISYKTIAMFKDDMAMAMGGFVAERMIYGHESLSTGPSSDLKSATQSAKAMVLRYGMSDKLGPRDFGQNEEMIFLAQEIHEQKNYSEKTAELIDDEISSLLTEARERAEKTLVDKRDQMEALVKLLLEKETVEEEEFKAIMDA
ncbi:MAG: cell division protein FtsH [Candidatus Magasanikbacteria bacterium CG_4_9_14_0_2_um_filter_42_11]|uniref:ATP-dependent zinc metalloprotease FtsH n=1 Tax=Candidatus Magasanikbacteria bacterium CG_4_9_14_0_2_um_filter_42_11 TaxID=1974643 RepID=A0A2M8F8X3_9BACT|nr:MAG: cell division protein FtsH [Candidatus Magasanikbacteria bacterium CG10_big_fil_rev_8_21_14_0_10_43_9]PIY92262.1 MAG: cell division protein FtsH [Candidatus Magasanikbacteria bacterium CG_4_10_14_0_8_um_filter_42_12]PJC52161.1 MAG: cell division protein FtsH [Candidatus Magasanikbacteria bacterium CG_4_9_14_0_2_um_filter_42_11]